MHSFHVELLEDRIAPSFLGVSADLGVSASADASAHVAGIDVGASADANVSASADASVSF